MVQRDLSDIVKNPDDKELLTYLIEQAHVAGPEKRNQLTVTSQVYVGLKITSLVTALDKSASAANRYAQKMVFASMALVIATLGLVVVTLVIGLTS